MKVPTMKVPPMSLDAVSSGEVGGSGEADSRPRVGFIVGPTGAGKTAIALAVAERIGAEIVNADSRQVYRLMDIGTAKPSPEELRQVPHHLIDIRNPDEPLDVAEFERLAHAAIAEILSRDRPVLIVGGSGLYLRVLRDGLFQGPAADPVVRARITARSEADGIPAMHALLREIDPEAAARISPNDLIRITRALEVYELTGVPISEHQARHRFSSGRYHSLTIGITRPRELLYEAINQRFDMMIEAGLIEEVRHLLNAGYGCETALTTTGYRELAAYLRGEFDLATAIECAKRESRRLAKRQMTWFRADTGITWLDGRTDGENAVRLFAGFFARQDRPTIRENGDNESEQYP